MENRDRIRPINLSPSLMKNSNVMMTGVNTNLKVMQFTVIDYLAGNYFHQLLIP